eukprot:m.54429 g.54429  ORF g.54429 m.54429 type:complete len:389 (+) comp13622_c0_seq1:75-1241(+)
MADIMTLLQMLLLLLLAYPTSGCNSRFATPINDHCLCRVGWTCQGNNCLNLSHIHVSMTGSIAQRVAYPATCTSCSCQPWQVNSHLVKMAADLADMHASAHVWDGHADYDRYRAGHLYSWGAGLSPVMSKTACEDKLGVGSLRCKVKIVGLGLSKTGTHTLSSIFTALGFESNHFQPTTFKSAPIPASKAMKVLHLADTDGWLPLLDDTKDFGFMNDLPMALFLHTTARYYPRAQFLLSVRDLYSWLGSYQAHVERSGVDTENSARQERHEIYRRVTYGTNYSDHPWISQYTAMRQVTSVISMIHPTRLLEVNVVNSLDRELVHHELCHLARTVTSISDKKCTRAHLVQPVQFDNGQHSVTDIDASLQRFKAQLGKSARALVAETNAE